MGNKAGGSVRVAFAAQRLWRMCPTCRSDSSAFFATFGIFFPVGTSIVLHTTSAFRGLVFLVLFFGFSLAFVLFVLCL